MTNYSYTSQSYVGILNYDEIEACIQSVNYIKEVLLPSQPEVYTESEYKSKNNIRVGAYFKLKKKEWIAYMYTDGRFSNSHTIYDSNKLTELANILSKAKEIIEDKTKE